MSESPATDPGSSNGVVIAIDGPAGSGKSTVARLLAERVGLAYLDTGAMYRAITFAVLQRGVELTDHERIGAIARQAVIEIGDGTDLGAGDDVSVVVDGADASVAIRSDAVTASVSAVSAVAEVRAELVSRQRAWVEHHGGGVLEGRDIGTVVFPNARLKIYLTASVETRARRRAAQQSDTDWQSIAADIERRDLADSTRADSPLAEASDAFVFDTTTLPVSGVVDALAGEFERRNAETVDVHRRS